MYRNLLLTVCALTIFLSSSGVSIATEAGNMELKKIAKTVLDLPAVEAYMQVDVSGDALKDKPNMPTSGKVTLAVDGSVKDDLKRKLTISVNTFKGIIDVTFLTMNDSFFLNMVSPGQEPLAYYFDPQNPTARKNEPMLSGILGQAKHAADLDNETKANAAVAKLSKKAEVSIIKEGHLLIKTAKRPDNSFNIFYDKNSYLPQKIEVIQPQKMLNVTINFVKWTTTGPVDTKLPLPESSYTLFGMEHLAKVIATLPKPKEVLSPKSAETGATDNLAVRGDVETADRPVGAPDQTEAAKGIGIIPPVTIPMDKAMNEYKKDQAANAHAELLAEVKESTREMRKIVNALRDPEFKQALLKLHLRLNRIERQLNTLEKSDTQKAYDGPQ